MDQVVVLSGSMEPGLQRGDILLLGCTACACYVAICCHGTSTAWVKDGQGNSF